MLKKLDKFSLPILEEKVLKFWQENDIFNKTLLKTKNKKQFVFYEGPPTANGRPGIHHVLSRAFKDIILRFKTMQGYYVKRQAGWDTHGLPVEIEVEKKLNLKSKKDIEKYGIAEFNQKCKESVWQYKDEWEKLTERIGFWLDLKNPYITYKNDYIERLWQIISYIFKKGLFYQGYKVVPWCPRCGTSLSSHEIALGYKTVKELSVYLKFKLKNKDTYILSWTTTPWTLPGNIALAVNPDFDYVEVLNKGEKIILAKNRLIVLEGEYKILKELKGKDLINLEYQPLFEIEELKDKNSYKIYPADFVTAEDGTGVVHTAVMYGEEDYELGKKVNLVQFHTVDESGLFNASVKELKGLYVKDKITEEKIVNYLKERNFLYKTEDYEHDYPFCWRCQTPILYYARSSWFVKMSILRKKLISENEKINWIPSHLKNGRFGEWLKEIKDWNFSRERYWGTPLPVWQCQNCKDFKVIEKISDLDKFSFFKSKNNYFLLRHGQAENNIEIIISCYPEKEIFPLTLKGRIQIEKVAKVLKNKKIDLIFASDLTRTKQTAEIIAQNLNLEIKFDKRLREIGLEKFNLHKYSDFKEFVKNNYQDDFEKFNKKFEGIESLNELSLRLYDFIKEVESSYQNKNILIVSHEYPLWILSGILKGYDQEQMILDKNKVKNEEYIKNGELRVLKFKIAPRDNYGFLDLHRPYIDEIVLKCENCGGEMKRVKEIADVWFDSGAMPFGSKAKYPADYIAEGVDQTRGWFYTLLAVGVLMDKGRAYKNVVSLGHVLDKNGLKMSKSKGNIVDPWAMIEKYGADSVRWYFYTINSCGEPKKFDENDLAKVLRQFILLIYNSYTFFDLYSEYKILDQWPKKKDLNVLDFWILTKLNYLIKEVTLNLNNYEIDKAARLIENFVYDLSRWYIRRSRRRFQRPENLKDYKIACNVLGFVLLNLTKMLAPFMPFLAEGIYQSLNLKNKEKSVHLEDWPEFSLSFKDKKILTKMEIIRNYASLVLAKRAEAKIKVRQPLKVLKIKDKNLIKEKELLEVLKEEINVKEIVLDLKIKDDFELDTEITHELKEEGYLRELIRIIQDFRQSVNLKPRDFIELGIETENQEINYLISKYLNFLKKEVNAKNIYQKKIKNFQADLATQLNDIQINLSLKKLN